jgi:hypothetical protein
VKASTNKLRVLNSSRKQLAYRLTEDGHKDRNNSGMYRNKEFSMSMGIFDLCISDHTSLYIKKKKTSLYILFETFFTTMAAAEEYLDIAVRVPVTISKTNFN